MSNTVGQSSAQRQSKRTSIFNSHCSTNLHRKNTYANNQCKAIHKNIRDIQVSNFNAASLPTCNSGNLWLLAVASHCHNWSLLLFILAICIASSCGCCHLLLSLNAVPVISLSPVADGCYC